MTFDKELLLFLIKEVDENDLIERCLGKTKNTFKTILHSFKLKRAANKTTRVS